MNGTRVRRSRRYRRIGKTVLVTVFALVLAACASTPVIPDSGDGSDGPSIAVLESVELGGVEQWILIRGRSVRNPVLLWLHGGPGSAQMPIAHEYASGLEDEFIVVHWDQRGAGKSNRRGFDSDTMTIDHFVEDARELIVYLQTRTGQSRVFLVGHSWGSQFGILLAQRYPELVHAYIGVSQVVDNEEAQIIGHAWLRERIQEDGTRRDRRRLDELGEPPFRDHSEFLTYIRLVGAYGGGMDEGPLLGPALRAPEYRHADYLRYLLGAVRGSGPMWEDPAYRAFDLRQNVSELAVPVFFIAGRHDHNTPLRLVREFADGVDAPGGAAVIVFDDSAHAPFIGEEDRFVAELVEIRWQTLPVGQ